MKVLVIGGGGMLGHKLVQSFRGKFDLYTTLRSELSKYENLKIYEAGKTFPNVDIDDHKSLEIILECLKPEVVINAVGIIKQIPSSRSVIETLSVNSIFPHRLAEITQRMAIRLINISTDCVFSGKKGKYIETDVADAEDLYGKSKNLGEVIEGNCLTIRTSIIGRELNTQHSLVEWFLSNEGGVVRGFSNAVFSGFPTLVLAEILANVISEHQELRGLYHVSSEAINKLDLLRLLKNAFGANIEIGPETSFVIDRSLNSSKFRAATGFISAGWEQMIDLMAADNDLYKRKRK